MELGGPRRLVVTCPHCGNNKVILARHVKMTLLSPQWGQVTTSCLGSPNSMMVLLIFSSAVLIKIRTLKS